MQKIKNPLIFLIEESIIYKDLIVGHLHSKFPNIKTFKSGDECLKNMTLNPDIIILDYSIEGMSGFELMKRVKETKPYVDFIFLSGQNDVEVAVNIMKHGAFDYVVKNEKAPGRLVKAIDQAIISTKKEKMNKGFTMGVFSFFFLLLLLITAILAIVLVFNLG